MGPLGESQWKEAGLRRATRSEMGGPRRKHFAEDGML